MSLQGPSADTKRGHGQTESNMQHVNFAAGVASVLCVTVVVSAAQAQSLAELARREEERRKAIASPGRVITNDNLSPVTTGPQVPPAPASPGAQAAPAPPTAPDAASSAATSATKTSPNAAASGAGGKDDGAKKGEAYWRQRLQQSRDALQRAEIVAAALQSRINALTTDAVNRDDPAQRSVITADREKALQELERVKKEIQQHTQAVADTQEEARRAGVPPGWVR